MSNFVSELRDWPAYGNDTPRETMRRRGRRRRATAAYMPRDYVANPVASHECAARVSVPIIPREQWRERIEERQAKKKRGIDLRETFGVTSLNQAQTLSCWANAVIDDMHMTQARNGGPVVRLSPASVVGPVTGFENVGGNCSEALAHITKRGACSQKVWPPNEPTARKFYTAAAQEEAMRHVVLEWWDLTPKSFDEMFSLLFAGFFVAYGNYSMSHAVLAIDPVVNERGEFGVLTSNSGLYRGRDGLTVFFGNYARPDDATSIRSLTFDYAAAA